MDINTPYNTSPYRREKTRQYVTSAFGSYGFIALTFVLVFASLSLPITETAVWISFGTAVFCYVSALIYPTYTDDSQ